MNPLRYHAENYPKEMKYIQGKYSPIKDIIYLCCVAIFIKEKKDQVTINSIKMKFKELEESICGGDLDWFSFIHWSSWERERHFSFLAR